MQILKYIHTYNHQIINKIGKEYNSGGADGQIFNHINDDNKVIKLSILFKCGEQNLYSIFKLINESLSFIENNKPFTCVRVYEHKFLERGERFINNSYQDYIVYYYIMEKLNQITDEEYKLFYSILSHEDRGIIKNYSDSILIKTLTDLNISFDFNFDKVLFFYKNLKNSKIVHNDLHPRNIMKDKQDNFRLIDFDRCRII